MTSYRVIGKPIPRADGPEKVTGAARYTADVSLPGMLWGKYLRSPYPHARIVSIDTSEARALPGVHAVLTGDDVQGTLYGRYLRDTPLLAQGQVRFAGERVAAVAAEDRDTALQAVDLIEVEYEELPPVLDPLEAMQEGAPLIHPDVISYENLPQPPIQKASNAFGHKTWGVGDIDRGFAEADLIVENTFTTPLMHQSYLEPQASLVWIDQEDRVQVWTCSKLPHHVKEVLATTVGVPPERIRVNHAIIGGDFGGKGFPQDVPMCYLLALRTGRPVKMVMTYQEEFSAGNPRHSSVARLKTGVKRDGTITAHRVHMVYDNGAYAGLTTMGFLAQVEASCGPYRVPNSCVDAFHVYTNTVPRGYMRAPGDAQSMFANECHLDIVASQLGMSPVEFRLKNLLVEGDATPTGEHFEGIRAKEILEAAVKAAGYSAPKPALVGRGISMEEHWQRGGESHAAVTLNPDGSVVVQTPIYEQGTGTYTMLCQIAAEELGVTADQVRYEVWDTDAVSSDTGILGSRGTRGAGGATHLAAREARQEVLRLAAELLGWPEEKLTLRGTKVENTDTGESRPWSQLLTQVGRSITGRADTDDPWRAPVTSFTAQVAEVSVDPETGEVTLRRVTTAHDVGTVLNPLGHQGQIDGGIVQGVGYALMEELLVEEGRVNSFSFGDYKIPNIKDIPALQTVLLKDGTGVGPYNIKGIGEGALAPLAAAIANALTDAVGIRIVDLPITAEKVLRALQAQGK